MYLELNLGDLYFFKVVVDGRLVEQTDNVDNQPLDEEKKNNVFSQGASSY